ncbi:MAG TPA: hypothetical protein VFC19_08530 [Candidatus Limnocylindrales bacterium]|nr:hypothetical protein [Candidatus Limnocylindrales bacterium]
MAKKETALQAAFTGLVDDSERRLRIGAAQRAEVGKLLAAKDLRKLADVDTDLSAAISRHTALLAAAAEAGSSWQKDLAAATKQWETLLAELVKIHGK